MPGTQAQKVIFVALEFWHEPPASTVALGLAEPDGADEPADGALVPQPARSATAAALARSEAPRPARRPG
jgi:hypothetical protein